MVANFRQHFSREIQRRWHASDQIVRELQIFTAAELAPPLTQKHDDVVVALKPSGDHAIGVLEQPDHRNDRSRINGAAVRLVVETHVAPGDRHAERAACRADAFDRSGKLPHDRRPFGVAEVQAIGRAQRPRAGAGDIARRLGYSKDRALVRIEIAVPAVAVDRQRQSTIGSLDPHDARAQSGDV